MKALTVQQPWAWAIVAGRKDVENRTTLWKHRGPLAIHAGTRLSQRGVESPLVEEALSDASYFDDPGVEHFEASGAIIGVVNVVDVHFAQPDCCESRWAETQYVEHGGRTRRQLTHLVLEDARFVDPIPMKGALGLWDVPVDVLPLLDRGDLR